MQLKSVASLSINHIIDIKVKIISKSEERQKKIIVRGSPCFKTDCIVTDSTDSLRLELWESAIDKVSRGLSYHFQNVTVKVFNDVKYLNPNKFTSIEQI